MAAPAALTYDDYTIGWICAIHPELNAARASLDEIFSPLPALSGDFNHYLLGRVGVHNVVVASLPSGSYGTNAAAQAATNMQRTFPRLRFGLMVGVGGGIPNLPKHDIRLGDVVVSDPVGQSSGLVQYDMGKAVEGKKQPERTGSYDKPPVELRNALASLKTRLRFEPDSHAQRIQSMRDKYPSLASDFNYPSSDGDVLFNTGYEHEGDEESCARCNPDEIMLRLERTSQSPQIHYGIIASGNQVVKDSVTRDYWRETEGVLCFEMEAAGLENFRCLVIRGICDYADSHKHKAWQPYAAATAAAFAKELLSEIPPLRIEKVNGAGDHTIRRESGLSFISTQNSDVEQSFNRSRSEIPVNLDKVQWPTNPWTVPRSVNRLFTGREDVSNLLIQTFLTESDDALAQTPRRFVISGLGGTGKSEVCIKYATDQRNKYWGVFWIDCKDSSTALESFQAIGRLCGDNQASIASVKDMLSSLTKRWLLIIDNADDINVTYSSYFPSGGKGDIIITTRNPELCELYTTTDSIHLSQLDTPLATELLLRSANVPQKDWSSKHEAATKIVEELANHTLALLHAGSFIRQQYSIEAYLERYRKRRDALFRSKRSQEDAVYDTVHATFEVSFSKLEEIRANGEPDEQVAAEDAINLITILAFMHYEGAIEQILKTASDVAAKINSGSNDKDEPSQELLDISRYHVANLPRFLPDDGDGDGLSRWRNACRMLSAFSLISTRYEGTNTVISMHSLIHKWIKERLSFVYPSQQAFQAQCRAWQETSRLLALAYSKVEESHLIYYVINPHVHACLSHPISLYSEKIESRFLLAILYRLAFVQWNADDDHNASQVLNILQAGILRDQDLSEKSRELMQAKVLTFKGMWLKWHGDRTQAILELQKVVSLTEKYLDKTHEDVLQAQEELAKAYRSNGKITKAIEMLEYVHDAREKSEKPDTVRILSSKYELAKAYKANGQVKAARALLEHIVNIEEKTLDEADPALLACQSELAKVYRRDGQIDEAIKLLQHVARIEEKKLAETDLDRLTTQHVLARAYVKNKQIPAAIKLLEHVVRIQEKKLHETHPYRLSAEQSLATTYLESGQIKESVKLLEHVVKITDKKLEESHPDRLASQHDLARAYLNNGQAEAAVKLLEHVISTKRETLDKAYPSILTSQHILAVAYAENEQIEAAVQLQEQVTGVKKETLEETDPDRLASEFNLARLRHDLGNHEDAIQLYEHVVEVEARTLSEQDPSRILTLRELDRAYKKAGRSYSDKAIQLRAKLRQFEANERAGLKKHRIDEQDEGSAASSIKVLKTL